MQGLHYAGRHQSKPRWLLPCGLAARETRLFLGERESNLLAAPRPHRGSSALARNDPNDSELFRDNTGSKLLPGLFGGLLPGRAARPIAPHRQRDIQTMPASIALHRW